MGAVTGACHAPVAGRQGNALAAIPSLSPVPIEKSAEFEMDAGGDYEQIHVARKRPDAPDFEAAGSPLQAVKDGRLPQKPHTPSESPRYFAAAG